MCHPLSDACKHPLPLPCRLQCQRGRQTDSPCIRVRMAVFHLCLILTSTVGQFHRFSSQRRHDKGIRPPNGSFSQLYMSYWFASECGSFFTTNQCLTLMSLIGPSHQFPSRRHHGRTCRLCQVVLISSQRQCIGNSQIHLSSTNYMCKLSFRSTMYI